MAEFYDPLAEAFADLPDADLDFLCASFEERAESHAAENRAYAVLFDRLAGVAGRGREIRVMRH